jgi:FkbM family methyltransferase
MKFIHPLDKGVHKYQEQFGKLIFDEVILKDCYGMRNFFKCNQMPINTILDIGANIGSFTLLSSMLYPSARRIAIEPSNINFSLLNENVISLNVETYQFALGDGKNRRLENDERFSGSDYLIPDVNGPIKSKTLSQIFQELKINPNGLIVKMDCEGGEMFLTDEDMKYLTDIDYFVCEIHAKEKAHLDNIVNLFEKYFKQHKISNNFMGRDMDNDLYSFKAEFTDKLPIGGNI